MEVAVLPALRKARHFVDDAVVPTRYLFGIFDDLVDEVAEVEDEAELVLGSGALVLEDHPAVAVELALVDVLAADEGELDRAVIAVERRGDRPADAAAVAVGVGEAVPVDMGRLEPADEHPRRPVGSRGDGGRGVGNDAAERLVFRDLDGEQVALPLLERPAGPLYHPL